MRRITPETGCERGVARLADWDSPWRVTVEAHIRRVEMDGGSNSRKHYKASDRLCIIAQMRERGVLSMSQLAAKFNCGQATVKRWIAANGVRPAVRAGKTPLYLISDFATFRPGRHAVKITLPDGRTFASIAEACRAVGMGVNRFRAILRRRGIEADSETASSHLWRLVALKTQGNAA